MKFTSEDLMKAMGLKVGDRVKMPFGMDEVVCKLNDNYQLCFEDVDNYLTLENLLNKEYEILPAPKRVGDRICDQFCAGCPLVALQCFSEEKEKKSLFLVLDETLNRHNDPEIYDLLKSRLDMEVEE